MRDDGVKSLGESIFIFKFRSFQQNDRLNYVNPA